MDRLEHDHRAVPWRGFALRSLLTALLLATATAYPPSVSASVSVSVGVAVGIPPPALPIYVQPPIPAPGYIWVPGYWAWDGEDYYWVPGTWVLPPYVGALWTPGYWGWSDGVYLFHVGYWGPRVGFYGGIDYGFGYTGIGYVGGYWDHGSFYYNRSVNRIENVHITNVYNRTVNNITVNRTSFNGGQGGIDARPTPQQASYARERHVAPLAAQERQRALASQNQSMRASFNHGTPPITATPRAGVFNDRAMGRQATPAAFGAQRANTAEQAPHDNMALRSSGFAPHSAAPMHAPAGMPANGNAPASRAGVFNDRATGRQPMPASLDAQRANTTAQAPHDNMALHSSGFAPHGAAPMHAPAGMPVSGYAPAAGRAMPVRPQATDGYVPRGPGGYSAGVPRSAPVYRAPPVAAQPRPQPQLRAQPQPHAQQMPRHGDEERH